MLAVFSIDEGGGIWKFILGEIIFENILLTWIADDGIFTNKKGEHTNESELIFKTLYVHVLRTYTAINMQG